MVEGLEPKARAGSDLDRKYRMALALYGILAVLAWFTIGEGKIPVDGRLVDVRLIPLVVIGGLALRTVLAHKAEKIRRGKDGEGTSTP